jgi:hypothetical protein
MSGKTTYHLKESPICLTVSDTPRGQSIEDIDETVTRRSKRIINYSTMNQSNGFPEWVHCADQFRRKPYEECTSLSESI